MRRSFGSSSGGMGGGGGMIRTFQRTVRAGVGGAPPEPFSSSANATTTARANSRKEKHFNKKHPTSPKAALTLSSSSSAAANSSNNNNNSGSSSPFSSLINLPVSAASDAAAPPSWEASSPTRSDNSEWGCFDGSEDDWAHVLNEDYVFRTVPSGDEVHHAVSALQQVLGSSSDRHFPKGKLAEDTNKDAADQVSIKTGFEKRVSLAESEVDWVEPSLDFSSSRMLQSHGSNRVYDAFHLLQTEPSVQRMVVSLSSDKAVWEAVLNNEVVKELKGSITRARSANSLTIESSGEDADDSNPVKDILSWILVNAKTRIMQLVDKITKIVNEVFQAPNVEKKGDAIDPFEEKLKTSLLLSVIVLLMVVITRAQSA